MKYKTDIETGLTKKQVQIRKKQKLVNYNSEVPTKSIGKIIYYNISPYQKTNIQNQTQYSSQENREKLPYFTLGFHLLHLYA